MDREYNVNELLTEIDFFEETGSFRNNNKFVKKLAEETLKKLDSILEKSKEK